ncbi:MAG TPA: transporter [Candidatus Polarisedimenticolaceae bacterium]|nr:transporter [Candidatus Polarisedimenticolaceae bacterium]
MSKNQVLPAAWLLMALPAAAQEALVTDRPDQTESAVVVPRHAVQVETGAIVERDDEVEVLGLPGTLVRYGLSPRLELRLAWPGWVRVESGSDAVDGLADPEIGMKLALSSKRELALLAHLSLPAGDEDVGAPDPAPAVRLSAAHDLGERVGFGWNLGVETGTQQVDDGSTRLLARWIYTASLGYAPSDAWGTFVEVFGDLPASDPAPAAHSLDGGVTWLLRSNLQLDLAAGIGLTDGAPDRFATAGLSLRFPR